jgi:hypothetical protein
MTTQKYTPAGRLRGYPSGTGRGSCPPHTPLLIEASKEGYYVAQCLACGLSGPEREDDWEAKLAFDESVEQSG